MDKKGLSVLREREGEKERRFSMLVIIIIFISLLCTYRAATVIATSEGVLWALVSAFDSVTCLL